MIVVQIAPEIEAGSGVGAVAHHLESEWRRAGIDVRRFTMRQAHGDWLPDPSGGWRGKLALALRVVWFSTIGTLAARRFLARFPGAVAICHNDALAGDVYVNHGILKVAMQARGGYRRRMLRNPMHLFTYARDAYRYRTSTHRVVVNLIAQEDTALRATYPRLRPRTVVIGNGVDVEKFRPPTPAERATARAGLGLDPDDLAVLFVGHEYDRKGLPLVVDAVAGLGDHVHLVVVGGTSDMVERLRRSPGGRRLADRLHTSGPVANPVPYFHACDVFAMPSAYESYGLVVTEALACGLPVVASAVGCVPDVIEDGVNGFVVEREAADITRRLQEIGSWDRATSAERARSSALEHSWESVATKYLELFRTLAPRSAGSGAGPA